MLNTEESRKGAMACFEVLKTIEDISDSTTGKFYKSNAVAVETMLHAAGNPSGYVAGFIAALTEFIKADFDGVGFNLRSCPQKPEAAMTEEEKTAHRASYEEVEA